MLHLFHKRSVWKLFEKVVYGRDKAVADGFMFWLIIWGKLAVFKSGDKKWNVIDDDIECFYNDMKLYKGVLCCE